MNFSNGHRILLMTFSSFLLLVPLYGSENLSLPLNLQHMAGSVVLDTTALRIIFGYSTENITGNGQHYTNLRFDSSSLILW
jgi:hypothetical protein